MSDPAFGQSDSPTAVAQPESVDEPADAAIPTSFDVADFDAPAPSAPSPAAPDAETLRRSSSGPSASERINALLNGQAPDSAPPSDFSSDFSTFSANRLHSSPAETSAQSADAPPKTEPTPAGAQSSARRSSLEETLTGAVNELRKPKVALAVGAVVAVLILILLIATGGKEAPENESLAVTQLPPTPAEPPPEPVQEASETINVESAESHCPPGSTEGMDAFSDEPGKAWQCVRAYNVDGQVLNIDLGGEYEIDSIGIVPGWDHVDSDGTDQWSKYRTASRVSYQFDDEKKTTFTQETLDQRTLVTTEIEPPVTASEVTLTVLKSGGDSSSEAVALSSIAITGKK